MIKNTQQVTKMKLHTQIEKKFNNIKKSQIYPETKYSI